MAVNKEQGKFISSDESTDIVYTKWTGNEKPKAIFLIAHGMAEYIGRYDDFARFMARNGYAVYGNDHLGHGLTASDDSKLGFFADKDGRYLLVEDIKKLCGEAKRDYPDTPVILLGHSMGSFVARMFCQKYSDEIDAAIFMGTSGRNPAAGAGIAVVNLISMFKGEMYKSKFVDKLAFGSYNKNCNDPKTSFDWLSTDEEQVRKYVNDDMCGYLFTLSAYREMFKLLGDVTRKKWADAIREDLPVLVIAGAEDPVGNSGKGVVETFGDLHEAGIENVAIILYDGMRHEVLNEIDKKKVYEDILDWCKKAID